MSAFHSLRTFVQGDTVEPMKVIRLDASRWRTPNDFYSALLPELGAPGWHGRNLDALYDSLSGGINEVEPPFAVEIEPVAAVSSKMAAFLAKVVTVFEDARDEFGAEVSISLR
jgi:RNAse (barnase) inhibitor barstar